MNVKTQVCIRLPDELKKRIEIRAKRSHRNFSNQLEDYLRIALIGEDNPDLPFEFIRDILRGQGRKRGWVGKAF